MSGANNSSWRKTPRLAIVIPCYNYAEFVGRAIESALAQKNDDCEIVVVDDGSSDGSWDVIRQYPVRSFRIPNAGQALACMHGVQHSTAPFVLFLDADDVLLPGAVAAIVAKLDDGVAKLQYPLIRIDNHGAVISDPRPQLSDFRERERLASFVLRNCVYTTPPTSGNVFRRDLCELARDIDYDGAFIDGVLPFAAPFFGDVVSLSRPLAQYRVHSRNDSGLGRLPDPTIVERDMKRFLDRMDHLRRLIIESGCKKPMADPRSCYYWQELEFARTVLRGSRPQLRNLPALLNGLLGQALPVANKAALAIVYLAGSVVSNQRARALLAFRLASGERSFGQFVKLLFKPDLKEPAHGH